MAVRTTEVRPPSDARVTAPAVAPAAPPSPSPAVSRKTPVAVPPAPPSGAYLEERGSFAHGACHGCDWVGPGRRARQRARTDAARHQLVHLP